MDTWERQKFFEEIDADTSLSAEDKETWKKLLGVESNEKFAKSRFMAQRTLQSQLDKNKVEHQRAVAALEDAKADYASMSDEGATRAQLDAALAEITKRDTMLAKAEADRLKIIQEARNADGGDIFLKKVGLDNPEVTYTSPKKEPEKKAETPAGDFLPRSDGVAMMQFFFDYNKMNQEYRDLTGKELDPYDFRQKVFAERKDKLPTVAFEEAYDIPKLRADRDAKALDVKLKAAREEGYNEAVAKARLGSGNRRAAEPDAWDKSVSAIPPEKLYKDEVTKETEIAKMRNSARNEAIESMNKAYNSGMPSFGSPVQGQ